MTRFAIAIALVMFASPSQGATVCRTGQCVQRVVKRVVVAAPVYQQYAPAYYQVGAQLQQQAVDTQGFRSSPEYIEYLQLKGFQAGVAAVQQQRVETTTAPPPVSTPEDFPRPTAPPNETLPSPPDAPLSPWEAFKAFYPTIAQNCSSCHGRKDPENPEGGLFLDGGMSLSGPENSGRRDSIVRMLWLNKMPKGKPADDQMISAILDELYPVEPEPAPAPPGPST